MPHRRVMSFLVAMATATITLVVPGAVLAGAGVTNAGVVGLAGLAIVIATAVLGWRVGLLAGGAVTIGVVLADASAGSWLAATLVMVCASALYGVSATRGWQHGLVLAPIALGFVIAEPPSDSWSGDRPLAMIALATAATAAFGVLVTVALSRGTAPAPVSPIPLLRARGFALMLGIAAAITTPITVITGWGHAGGWLIMTPLIVIQPSLRDAVGKSMRRALGTVVGFVVAFCVSVVLPEPWALYLIGAVFAGFSLYVMGRRWDYSIFAAAVTVAVVLLEGTSTSVADTGRWRLIATLLGVGIAVAVTAALSPLYVRASRRAESGTPGAG